jgi:hypothetical protein
MSAVAEVKARALEMSAVICGVRFIFVYRLVAMAIHARMAAVWAVRLMVVGISVVCAVKVVWRLSGRERAWIDVKGKVVITVEFQPQKWF